ncbi:nitrous oxide reductase family maturation protein NosD [Microbaculum sp. FT89]|uniref:nitrous oxide reductase family maturation protein NosD n=1 Tax=Microbaculum sp. FT89 TaxID=3447298 RepID=UPI003F52F184
MLRRLTLSSLLAATVAAVSAQAAETVVAPAPGALQAAIDNAQPGDVLRLRPGVYSGAILIEKPLTVAGTDGVEIQGGGTGTVITVTAPDVVVSRVRVSGSGSSHQSIDSGIKLTKTADRGAVLDSESIGNLYGIDIHGARDARVAGNLVVGRTDFRMNERGNGVYVWNAAGAVIEGNTVRQGRDGIFVNTSARNVIRDNRFEDLRFAVHYMYGGDGEIVGNVSVGNHLGYALMFSDGLTVRDNISIDDRDYGIMLNYANGATIEGNYVRAAAEKCLFMYNANKNRLADNRFEACEIGIHFTAGSDRNTIVGNAFIGNQTQVKYVGTRYLEWSDAGRGNYWSDHAAFDVNGDGIADSAYRPNDIIDQVLWTQPAAKLLLGSPAVQLVRWSQSQFPALLPGGIVDSAPLMTPVDIPVPGEGGRS